jgi:hypothetical protein
VHFTRHNSPDDPVQVAFSVIDESGHEEIITGQCPTAAILYQLLSESGWLQTKAVRPSP